MGAAPIVIFRGLPQSHPQGHGELGPPHFPGYTPAWYNQTTKNTRKFFQSKKVTPLYLD